MENRKYKINNEDIRLVLSKEWNLSLSEVATLNLFLEVLKNNDLQKLSMLDKVLEDEFNELLHDISDSDIENCAESYFDLEEKSIEGFEDWEIRREFSERNLAGEVENSSLKDSMEVEELTNLFLSKDYKEREEILKQLRK